MLILFVLVFVSAISVVYTTHYQRKLFIQWQQLQQQKDDMNIEWRKLLLEENAWSTTARVQRKAATQLRMKIPRSQDMIFIPLEDK